MERVSASCISITTEAGHSSRRSKSGVWDVKLKGERGEHLSDANGGANGVL